ncbi:hypothetical protein CRUP_038391, partial [Coryphaenoides rupestris]
KQLSVWVGRLLLYSCLIYLVACVVAYSWYLPEHTIGRIILAMPFVIFPLLVWLLRKMLIALCVWRTQRNDEKLEELKAQKKKMLEDVIENETYKNAKLILERFDPDSKKYELNSSLMPAPMTTKPGQDLRQRSVASKALLSATATPTLASPTNGASVLAACTPISLGPPAYAGRSLHSAPGGPPERSLSAGAAQQSLMRRPVTHSTPVPGAGMHPPGPPLARPVLPRDRGALDRVIEYLVGYGPQNRYALICQQCLSHNGMALKGEFEYVAFRCAYCYFLNPAQKTRPQAPRLPDTPSGERTLEVSEAPMSPPPLVPGWWTTVTSDDLEVTPDEELPSEKSDEEQNVSAMEVE